MLVSTKKAARELGLSEYELRRGYLEGKYPAIEIGVGKRAKRLRWNIDLVRATIRKNMIDDLFQKR